jgi:hypothetical protein
MNSIFKISLILLLFVFNACKKETPSRAIYSRLVSFFPLDADANDAFSKYDGVVYGATPGLNGFRKGNGAFMFNGSGDYIGLGSNFDFPERTVNLWFNATTIDLVERHIYISDNPKLLNGFTQIKIIETNGKKEIRSSTGVPHNEAHQEVSENTWYMITVVARQDSTKHYLNGNLIGEFVNGNVKSSNGDISSLLGSSRVHDRFFKGSIDDVSIYDRVLTQKEVKELLKDTYNPVAFAKN